MKKESSHINDIKFDSKTKKLYITFTNGGKYEYDKVPDYIHDGLVSANSQGEYFHKHIRGLFIHKKV